jgi:hypothetical protein
VESSLIGWIDAVSDRSRAVMFTARRVVLRNLYTGSLPVDAWALTSIMTSSSAARWLWMK